MYNFLIKVLIYALIFLSQDRNAYCPLPRLFEDTVAEKKNLSIFEITRKSLKFCQEEHTKIFKYQLFHGNIKPEISNKIHNILVFPTTGSNPAEYIG